MHSHQISAENIAAAIQHSHQIKQHGQKLEQLGADLMQNLPMDLAQCQAIQAIGRQIQEHGQTALALATNAQQQREYSTEAFVQVGMEHIAAIQLHVEANRILLQLHQPAFPHQPSLG